jgi:uncharacterized protein YbbC (DUF1343 family)
MMRLGMDRLLAEPELQKPLLGKRVALLGHPASVTGELVHSLDALIAQGKLRVTAAFGPQHGMRGEKQDNMIESADYADPVHRLPVFSLYGEVRRPTDAMMESFDVLLIDLQDVGCRIYTYLTTLLYLLEACSKWSKPVWVLDRPNPAGRPVEGTLLRKGWESFVGASAVPMRHGLTLGEIAKWLVQNHQLSVELRVVEMQGYSMSEAPGYGWPVGELAWVNPSPNMPVLSTARCYAGTVLLEGTNLSEGRGTTRPLEMFGVPGMDPVKVLAEMRRFEPRWLAGARVRACYFEPTFHKYKGELCAGFQWHVEDNRYEHEKFQPYRLMNSFFKALRKVHPGLLAWRQPPYEYETVRLPIDLLNGGTEVREWVDDPQSTSADLEALLTKDEKAWSESRRAHLLYR